MAALPAVWPVRRARLLQLLRAEPLLPDHFYLRKVWAAVRLLCFDSEEQRELQQLPEYSTLLKCTLATTRFDMLAPMLAVMVRLPPHFEPAVVNLILEGLHARRLPSSASTRYHLSASSHGVPTVVVGY